MKREAGILLHITSLPSRYGIGDLGPEARNFADFLNKGSQTYWQLLPMNPVDAGSSFSPYSSCSTFAGNTLLISIDELISSRYLEKKEAKPFQINNKSKVDFSHALKAKSLLLEKAFTRWKQQTAATPDKSFSVFCAREKAWLDDFALYTVLKDKFNGQPWYEWPIEYKQRRKEALSKFTDSSLIDL